MCPNFVIFKFNFTCRVAKVHWQQQVDEPVHTTQLQANRLSVFKQVWPTIGADMVIKILLPSLEGK